MVTTWTEAPIPMVDEGANRSGSDGSSEVFDRGFEGARRRQAKLGLSMTPAQRLEWLERAMEEFRRMQGLASSGKKSPPPPAEKRPPDSMPA